MQKLIDLLFGKPDPTRDWNLTRMRALTPSPIGPRYPTGLFKVYNPEACDE